MPDSLPGIVERLSKAEEAIRKHEQEIKEVNRRDVEEKLRLDKVETRQEKALERVGKIENHNSLMEVQMLVLEKSLIKIEENTTFTRRQVTGIVIGAAATAVIGGAVALIYGMIGGGLM